ncbi:uncharacterized protein ACO6RY_14792 [Pungitius sinensis]
MGKANVCLKRSYYAVLTLIGVLSGLVLAATLFSHGHLHSHDEIETMISSIYSTYGISIITLILAVVGVYGACKKKKWALIVFVVGMILGSLVLIAADIGGLARRSQDVENLKKTYLQRLPLSNENMSSFEFLQTELQCCGLDQGYVEWGYNIPESCLCTEQSTNPCVAAPINSSIYELKVDGRPVLIYEQGCLTYIVDHVLMILDTAMGIILGVILLWVLSVVLGIFLLCQMSKKEDVPVVVYSQQAKAGNYSPLTDIVEHT